MLCVSGQHFMQVGTETSVDQEYFLQGRRPNMTIELRRGSFSLYSKMFRDDNCLKGSEDMVF